MVLSGLCGVDEVESRISLLSLPGVRSRGVAAGDADQWEREELLGLTAIF